MPVQLPITTYGMDILRKKTKQITKTDNSLIELVDNMFYTLDNANGVGLAAPQVNFNLELAVVDVSQVEEYKHIKPVILINPEILDSHGEALLEEGCLSIPEVRAQVPRADKIYIKFLDLNLDEIKMEAEGFFARVIQHEIDHLNGILFVDRIPKEELNKFKAQLKKIQKRKVETDYPLYDPKAINL